MEILVLFFETFGSRYLGHYVNEICEAILNILCHGFFYLMVQLVHPIFGRLFDVSRLEVGMLPESVRRMERATEQCSV